MKIFSLLLLLLLNISSTYAKEIASMNVETLNIAMKKENFKEVLIDVRTPMEIKESGYIPTTKIFKNAHDKDVNKFISTLSKDKTYIIYCYAGSRSLRVAQAMDKKGYKVINLYGGISKWKSQGFKTTKN